MNDQLNGNDAAWVHILSMGFEIATMIGVFFLSWMGWKKKNGWHPPAERRKLPDRRKRRPKPKQK